MNKKKRILVTGDEGFVGGHLVKALRDLGHEVIGFDLKSGHDIRNIQSLEGTLDKFQPEVVYHLAALAGVRFSLTQYEDYYRTNVIGTQNVVNACKKAGVRQIISFSSSSVYGGSGKPVKEEDPMNPISPYGISKLAGEHIVRACRIPIWNIVRPFTIYGESGRKDMVMYKFLTGIKDGKEIIEFVNQGGKTTTRGYTYVGDIVNACIKLLDYGQSGDFNIGGQEVINIKQLIKIMEEIVGKQAIIKPLPLLYGDQPHSVADISKSREELNYIPKTTFKETLERIYKTDFANGK